MRSAGLLTAISGLLTNLHALDAVVSFNELMYHPRDGGVEWVELHNMMSVDVDLSEWSLSGGIDYQVPSGTVIPGGGHIVIEGEGGGAGAALGPFAGRLDNNGERVRLRNNSGREMDEIDYGDSGRWPVAADGSGATLAKKSPRLASGEPESWTSGLVAGGTPGTANFPGSSSNPTETTTTLLGLTSSWRFNEGGIDPGASWAGSAHPAGAGGWEEGPGVLAFENRLDDPIGTTLVDPQANSPFVITYYFETEFTLSAGQAATLQRLELRHLIDDGAVFYLNGAEVWRYNLPGGQVGAATWAENGLEAAWSQTITLPHGAAVEGSNRFSVEVHQATVGSSDVVFGLELEVVTNPVPTESLSALQINEVSAADAVLFSVELINAGSAPLETSGLILENPAVPGGGSHTLAGGILQPGAFLELDENTLGFRVADEGRLFLITAGGAQVLDAVRVKNRPLGRLPGAGVADRFFTPDALTPGAPNTFAFHDEIVINEIMYHHRPQPSREASPGEIETLELAGFDAEWRFNQSGADLGALWAQVAHPIGGSWQSGPGLIGFEFGALPEPIVTTLVAPTLNNPFVVTYYFEKDLTLTATEHTRLQDVEIRHILDDGAVIYVNGVEVARPCMPAGAVTAATLSNCLVRNATVSDPLTIPAARFVAGANRISVELHQSALGSTDIVFGCSIAARLAPEGTQSQPYAVIDEEWVELFNRSGNPVDLTGWSLDGAIGYRFPDSTIMAPGDYLVVGRDGAALAAKHPQATILGDFSGRLGNRGDYVKLEDASENPADEVRYYDGGRWPAAADGGGSSLELRDPEADNATAEAWAASDERGRSAWQTFTYQARGTSFPGTSDPTAYNEFIMGLLDSGEVLLDDISVLEDPNGSPRELIQNGGLDTSTLGNPPARWRMVGTHGLHGRTAVIENPDGGGRVLHLVATGPMWHQQNQCETTLKAGGQFVTISSSEVYEISFRAKWLSGSPLLNTRLYFDRAARTHVLAQPAQSGTPGAPNSTLVANLGPTIEGFHHRPVRPAANGGARVEAVVSDPDGVAAVTLNWSRNGGGFNQVAMTVTGGRHIATIPGQAANTKVQFYLSAQDNLGAVATFPAAGEESRAMYRVGSNSGGSNPAQHLEIVMQSSDESVLGTDVNQMSNHRLGGTLIYEDEAFYDVGIRLKGSQRGRPDLNRRGFSIAFNSDQQFRGVLKSIGLDRSGGWRFGRTFGQDEILIWHFMNRAGGIPALHNDVAFLDAPGVSDGSAQLQLARFTNQFLGGQYVNGDEGSIHNFELIYWPTTTTGGPEGLKRPNPDSVNGVPVRSLGDNKEAYRYYFQLRNNQAHDDYGGVMALGELFSRSTPDMLAAAPDVIDVDEWLRTNAAVALAAVSDSYFNSSNSHNARFYQRPSDGRVLLFPWDMDFAFITGATSSLTPNSDLTRLLGDPVNKRLYWGHVHDILNRAYRSAYMGNWVEHYEIFLTGQDLTPLTSFIQQRAAYALGLVNGAVSRVNFSITTNGGNGFDSNVTPVTLAGDGWLKVREIRLAGSGTALPLTWTDDNSWRVDVPLGAGANALTLEAIDFEGDVISTDTITVTNTSPVIAAAADNFVLTELMYNPAEPTAAELSAGFLDKDEFEFAEFQNVGTATIDAGGVSFDSGIDFTIPAGTQLAPGQHVVIVRNTAAFAARYASTFPSVTVADEYRASGTSFRNSGERVHVLAANGSTLADFTYDDNAPWPTSADGDGYSLVPVAPAHANFDPADPIHWRSSRALGGDPGETDAYTFAEWSGANGNVAVLDDPENDQVVALLEYATGRFPQINEGPPAPTIDPADLHTFSMVLALGADEVVFAGEIADDLLTWETAGVVYAGSVNNGDGTRTVFFTQNGIAATQFARVGVSLR